MVKKLKKAFTITELVIVIAVVAILAAVLIPTFANIIDKANESADTQTVANINEILSADEILDGKPATMHDAMQAVEEGGYKVENLTPTREGYEIVWNETSNRLALMDGDKVVYGDDAVKSAAKEKIWKITREDPDAASGYSYYLAPDYAGSKTNITVSAGFDAGENSDIAAVTLNIPAGTQKSVTVRTNGGAFTMYAPDSEVSHYGEAVSAEIRAAAPDTYTLYGRITGTLTVRKGHADLRTGSYAALLVCEPASGESVEITYASTENVGEIANNGNAENVTLPGDAAEVMLDKTFAYAPNADGTGYVVTGFGEEATVEDKTNAVIPATYSGKLVVEIADYAFQNQTALQSVTIPASVETIGRSAFERSTITSIVFAEGSRLKDWREDTSEGFGYSVFSISNIESVRFAENSTFTVLPGRTFASCSALSAVYLPASVKTIGGAAFDGAANLQRIDDSGTLEILSGVTAIEVSAFKNCANLAGTVAFSNNIRVVSETAFRGCKKITGFTFRGSLLTEIGEGAFCDTGITSIALPASVKTIGVQAFMGTPLASVAIPASVTEIGESAFKYCKQLKEVTFAANSQLTSIGEDSFMGCSLLEDVSLENCTALTSIGCKAFNQCAALSSVIIPATVTQIDELGLYIGSETSPAAIYCYAEQGQKPSGWDDFWCREEAAVYWNGEWELQEDVPVPLNA